jgi:hypothetical protein
VKGVGRSRTFRGEPSLKTAPIRLSLGLLTNFATCVDARFGARRIFWIGAARGQVLTCVRPLMRLTRRRPGWEFADQVQISCSGPVPTAKTTLNPAHVRPERRALHNEPRLDDHQALGGTAKLGLLQDRFFELGISDLAVRHDFCDAERAEESDREEKSCRFHRWSDLGERGC